MMICHFYMFIKAATTEEKTNCSTPQHVDKVEK